MLQHINQITFIAIDQVKKIRMFALIGIALNVVLIIFRLGAGR